MDFGWHALVRHSGGHTYEIIRSRHFIHKIWKPIETASGPRAFAAAATIFLASSAFADVLELKTGEIVQGKFISGSSATIRFEVNGQQQTFAIQDVLNIGFTDTTESAAPPPPPS